MCKPEEEEWGIAKQAQNARGGPKLRSFGRRPKLFSLRLRHRPPKLSLETFGLSFYPKSWLLLHINFDLKDNFDLENLFLNLFLNNWELEKELLAMVKKKFLR